MGGGGDFSAFSYPEDLAACGEGAEAVGDEEDDGAFAEELEVFKDAFFGGVVYGGEGVV